MTNWTPQQLDFYDKLESSTSSILLDACAGSGKTTTLAEGTKYLKGSVLAIAFSVRIKKTLEEKLGASATCKTLNGLGHGAMVGLLGRRVKIDVRKVGKIVTEVMKALKAEDSNSEVWSAAVKLVAIAKNHGIIPNGTKGLYVSLTPDSVEEWEELAAHYDIIFNDEILEVSRESLRVSNSLVWQGVCDFDDQVYIPTCWGGSFERFDNLIVDEAQDLSEIQHKMIKKSLKKGGRLIAVGDPNQAIYGWRGAMSDSIFKLVKSFDLKRMELTVSFRCARAIVDEAKKLVPRIESHSNAPNGLVTNLESYKAANFQTGSAVLCRNNAPLIRLAYRLISKHKGVYVVGRDIGAGLKALVKQLQKHQAIGTKAQLLSVLERWRKEEINKATAKEQWYKVASVEDKADSLYTVVTYGNSDTIKGVIQEIDTLFSKESAPITLSTIHKAKGLEWDRVFLLDQHLIPSKWSLKAVEKDPKKYAWMLEEENNIRYVAITRTKKILTYISTKGWRDD